MKQICETPRKNRSTGPVTSAGKAVVARNPIKHGLSSPAPVIPGESPDEWRAHLKAMLDDLQPRGYLEGVLAQRIAELTWRLRRVSRYESEACGLLFEDADSLAFGMGVAPQKVRALAVLPDDRRMEKVKRFETHLHRCLMRIVREWRELRKDTTVQTLVLALVNENADYKTNVAAKQVVSSVRNRCSLSTDREPKLSAPESQQARQPA